jgi:hypothetical protein
MSGANLELVPPSVLTLLANTGKIPVPQREKETCIERREVAI